MATSKDKTRGKRKSKTRYSPKERASERGLWSGYLSFGLINIPVRLVSAREQPEIHFTMVDPKNLSPVGYRYYNKTSGEEISRGDTVKAFEYKKDRYVLMSDADFKKANPEATQSIDIESFVALEEIDPVFFERAYYLMPKRGGERAYGLLCAALDKSNKVAVAKLVLHTKQHLAAVIPRGSYLLLELLHFAEDVKELRELASQQGPRGVSKVTGPELEMAERLIEGMTSKWKPEVYKDTYREDILKMVHAKVRAGKATEISEDFIEKPGEEVAEVVDLMPLLKKSLEGKGQKSRTRRSAS